MEDKIEVGEFVRSKDGYIGKVELIIEDEQERQNYYICEKDNVMASNYRDNIVKHSKNIIDLIEVGDYVNEYPVRIVMGKKCNFDLNEMNWVDLENVFLDGLIQDIVTKEQFDSIKYEI